MNFLKTLGLLLLCAIAAIGVGFLFLNRGEMVLGHKIIGLSTLFIFFVVMPLFIWARYKNKDLSKFNFHQKKEEDEDEDWDVEDKSRLN